MVRKTAKIPKVDFLSRVKSAGYKSVDDFFARNAAMSFAHMGKIVGLSFGGIQYHYRKWHVKAIGGARGKR